MKDRRICRLGGICVQIKQKSPKTKLAHHQRTVSISHNKLTKDAPGRRCCCLQVRSCSCTRGCGSGSGRCRNWGRSRARHDVSKSVQLFVKLLLLVEKLRDSCSVLVATAWRRRLHHSTAQYNTVQYSTVQYNTVQYNTIQYNTIQYKVKQSRIKIVTPA